MTCAQCLSNTADIGVAYQPISEYDVAAARSSIESKVIGAGSMVAAHNGPLGSPASALAVGRIGRTKDIADTIIALLRHRFIIGTGDQGRPKKSGAIQ